MSRRKLGLRYEEEYLSDEEFMEEVIPLSVESVAVDLIDNPRFFQVLRVIYEHENTTIAKICKILGFSESSVNRYVRNAIAHKLVKVTRGLHGKRRHFELTSEGKRAVDKALDLLKKALKSKARLYGEEYERIADKLAKILDLEADEEVEHIFDLERAREILRPYGLENEAKQLIVEIMPTYGRRIVTEGKYLVFIKKGRVEEC